MHESTTQFAKYFGLPTGIALIVTSIIGSGVYKKAVSMSAECQSPELLLAAWALAGLVTLFGVLTLAEIAILLPVSGGPYAYLREIFGEKAGFSYGWASFACIQTASTAAIAYVFAQSVGELIEIPSLSTSISQWTLLGIFQPLDNLGVKLVAVTLIGVLTFINCRGVHLGGGIGNLITIIVLGSLILTIVLAFSSNLGSFENLRQDASTYPPDSMAGSFGFIKVMFVTMLAAFWAYEGWINVGFVGDEIRDPQKNIPRILIYGILLISSIYLLVNAAYLYIIPIDEMIRIGNTSNSVVAVEVIRLITGPMGAKAMSLLIIITTLGCTNSTILTSSRIYYAMAKDGLFFKSAAYVDPVAKVPTRSLVLFALWSSLLVFSGSFEQLTDMLVFAQFIFYALVIYGVFVLRKKMPNANRPYRVIGYPWVPALFIVFCIVLICNTLIAQPRNAGLGLFLISLGAPIYIYLKAKHQKPGV